MSKENFWEWMFCLLFVGLLLLRPIDDMDLLTQMRLGQLILSKGALLEEEPLNYRLAGQPMVPMGWLAQVLLAFVFQVGGWNLVHFLRSVVYSLAIIWAGTASLGRAPPAGSAFPLAWVLSFLALFTSANTRPQMVAALAFTLLYRLALSAWPFRWRLIGLVLIGVFWQNCHASLPVGVVLLSLLAFAEWIDPVRGSRRAWELGLQAAILAGLQFVTPQGLAILAMSRRNYEVARLWLGISEWVPPWYASVWPAMIFFWVGLLMSLVFLLARPHSVELRHWLLFIPFTGLTLWSSRFVLFWALALCPVWAAWFGSLALPPLPYPRSGHSQLLVLALGLAALGVAVVGDCPLARSKAPLRAIAALREALPVGRIYNFREWGGPLAFLGSPGWQTAIDGRLYLFSREQWQAYFREAAGETPLSAIIDHEQPDAFFLHRWVQAGLVARLAADPAWRNLPTGDPEAAVFLRNR